MKRMKQKIKSKLGEEKTARLNRILSVARVVKTIVCWVLIAVLSLAIIAYIFMGESGDSPSILGCSLHRIHSDAMKPELSSGDIIINTDIKDPSEIQVDDIITINGGAEYNNQRLTRRVLIAPYDDGSGNIVLVTKADANDEDDGEISISAVESKYERKAYLLKLFYDFFFSGWGFAVFLILLVLVFIKQLRNIIKNTSGKVRQEDEREEDEDDSSQQTEYNDHETSDSESVDDFSVEDDYSD